ncbi:MAG: hypothetical protein A2107_00010 [Verrucomicrobia bacterium GWF2_62_7]|nr:MAG: hypothetical protein A2107_00010 [Verrucomicrobia bacterium GWF2_62_7]
MKKITVAAFLFAQLAFSQTVINGNRIITGSWDASDAGSTKPAKTGPVLPAICSAGEVFFKSDATAGRNLYVCPTANTWTPVAEYTFAKSLTLFDPAPSDSGRIQLMFPTTVTIRRIACSVKAANTVSINLDERAAATPDVAGTAVMISALVCGTDQSVSTSFSNAGVAARVPLALTISDVSGVPDTLRVYIEYSVD